MDTYVLIPGAGGLASYWHLVVDELRARGAEAVAVDLPAADESAGLQEYADTVIEAIGGRTGIILVAQSMAGFTAPLVCERVPVELLVLVNAMVPVPGEAPGDWWANTGFEQARQEQAARDGRSLGGPNELLDAFFHDVPPDITAQAMAEGTRSSRAPHSRSHGRWQPGRMSRRVSCRPAMTASFPSSSSVGSSASGWGSRLTRCPAVTWSRWPNPSSWQTDSRPIARSCTI